MNLKFIKYTIFFLCLFLIGCSSFGEYIANITSDEREEVVVYKRNTSYEDTQFDLEVPPDLINPHTTDILEIPEYAGKKGIEIFTIDTKLDGIKIVKQGRDSFLIIKNTDKKLIWESINRFWQSEGFKLNQKDYTLGIMKTVFLENLSEAQLGTIQKYVGRYVPLLVAPETRDSFKTRLLLKDESIDILITHYGKEYMSDGDSEFRWQNRPRDPEIESEMISRLFIYLGGDEAKSKGYTVVKSTGARNRASLNIDEYGIHTLFIADIYERVWPQTIKSLETIGIRILSAKEGDGVIKLSATEVSEPKEESFFDNLAFWSSSSDMETFSLVLSSNQDGTYIEVQDDNFTDFSNVASQEVIRALYTEFR
jgi:outer membrane protein assembly factor BamC